MFAINSALRGFTALFIKAEEQEHAQSLFSLSVLLISFAIVQPLIYYATRSAIYFRGVQSAMEESEGRVLVLLVKNVQYTRNKTFNVLLKSETLLECISGFRKTISANYINWEWR